MGTNTQSVVNTMWPNVKLENEQVQLEKNMLVQTERWAYRNTQEGSTQNPCWQSWTRLLRSNETLFSRGDRGQRSREPKHMPRVANRDRDLFTVSTHNPEAMFNTVRTSNRSSWVSRSQKKHLKSIFHLLTHLSTAFILWMMPFFWCCPLTS